MVEFNLDYSEKGVVKALKIKSGEIMFLVGANGTGKSTLIHHFLTQNSITAIRVTAHRQVWLHSNSSDLTAVGRAQLKGNITHIDQQEQSRWKDEYGSQRSQAIIYDLIDRENVESREIANAVRNGSIEEARELGKEQSSVEKMNKILRISNLHFQVIVGKESELVAVRDNNQQHSITSLSDGERNSLLIIASVLTAPKNNLILLDEPERHLHRSIVSPLLSTLLAYREDCAFVVSTHDITLPRDQKNAKILLLREYSYPSKYWVSDYIDNIDKMDEEVSTAILGSRRVSLFIEGIHSSLDMQLYQILYPNISIRALGTCMDVERTVRALRNATEYHWISAYGIIDRDNKTEEECTELRKDGIIPLEQYSVESLYYHPSVIKALLNRTSSTDINSKMSTIEKRVLEKVRECKDELAARLVEKRVKDRAVRECPNWQKIHAEEVIVNFSTANILKEEKSYILSLINEGNINKLICRYPVRQTQVLGIISQEAGFKSKKYYEDAVRKMLTEDDNSLDMVRNLVAPITNILTELI